MRFFWSLVKFLKIIVFAKFLYFAKAFCKKIASDFFFAFFLKILVAFRDGLLQISKASPCLFRCFHRTPEGSIVSNDTFMAAIFGFE